MFMTACKSGKFFSLSVVCLIIANDVVQANEIGQVPSLCDTDNI